MLCRLESLRGLEKEEKIAEIPKMNEVQAREFTKKIKADAAEEEPAEALPGLGFKM